MPGRYAASIFLLQNSLQVVSKSQLLQILPPYTGKALLIERQQGVSEIITEILQAHKTFASHYDVIAPLFDTGQDPATLAADLWNFCKANIPYIIEPDSRQTTKSPAAILAGAFGSDCKHYASFIGGVLDAVARHRGTNISWCYRFASYNILDSSPQHVFVVMQPGANEIWIDPVLTSFNNRKLYFFKTDKRPKMSLYRVSGINRPKTVGSFLSNIWHGVKAVAASAPRNAFMALVRLNVHGFATNLLARDADPVQQAQVKDKWERKLGGSYSALKSAFVDGAKNKKIFGVAYVAGVPGTISGEPVTTTALLTAAAAIIATLGDLLKALPSAPTTPGEDQAVQDAINQAAAEQQQQDAEKPDYSKFLLLGGAGLAAYLLLKKK